MGEALRAIDQRGPTVGSAVLEAVFSANSSGIPGLATQRLPRGYRHASASPDRDPERSSDPVYRRASTYPGERVSHRSRPRKRAQLSRRHGGEPAGSFPLRAAGDPRTFSRIPLWRFTCSALSLPGELARERREEGTREAGPTDRPLCQFLDQ